MRAGYAAAISSCNRCCASPQEEVSGSSRVHRKALAHPIFLKNQRPPNWRPLGVLFGFLTSVGDAIPNTDGMAELDSSHKLGSKADIRKAGKDSPNMLGV